MEDSIGARINEVLRRKGISVPDFAKAISCTRSNVYKIIGKNDINLDLLRRISIVLEYNFFKDLANNPDLAKVCNEKEDADTQFLKVIQGVLHKLKIDGCISFGYGLPVGEDVPLPDYTLSPYFITFTKGETFEERAKGKLDNVMIFQKHIKDDMLVTECINSPHGTQSLDIRIDYKTEEEWEKIVAYAFQLAREVYLKPTKDLILKCK